MIRTNRDAQMETSPRMTGTSAYNPPGSLRWVWWGALIAFVLAGATGALFRFIVAYGLRLPLDLTNVRHAHSHLMYFGWATPLLMALIWHRLPERATAGYKQAIRWVLGSIFAASAIAYPLFLAFGYTPVPVGSGRMPIAVIGAGLNIFGWYGFVAVYVRATWGVPRTRPMRLWDVAIGFMVLATLGAWGLSLLKPLGLHDPFWAAALTHVFLDLFSEGWFVLGVLGVAWSVLGERRAKGRFWSLWLVGGGLPFTFVLALPEAELSAGLKLAGGAGGALVGAGLLAIAGQLVRRLPPRRAGWWGIPLVLLAAKALGQLGNSLIPGVWWGGEHGLRILYLHLMLLGFVSLGLVAAARHVWEMDAMPGMRAFYVTVGLLLLSLLPLTSWWPAAWSGPGAFQLAAWMALGPVLAAAWMLARSRALRPPTSANETATSVKTV